MGYLIIYFLKIAFFRLSLCFIIWSKQATILFEVLRAPLTPSPPGLKATKNTIQYFRVHSRLDNRSNFIRINDTWLWRNAFPSGRATRSPCTSSSGPPVSSLAGSSLPVWPEGPVSVSCTSSHLSPAVRLPVLLWPRRIRSGSDRPSDIPYRSRTL